MATPILPDGIFIIEISVKTTKDLETHDLNLHRRKWLESSPDLKPPKRKTSIWLAQDQLRLRLPTVIMTALSKSSDSNLPQKIRKMFQLENCPSLRDLAAPKMIFADRIFVSQGGAAKLVSFPLEPKWLTYGYGYIYIPGTQITRVLIVKDLLLEGSIPKKDYKQVPGI